MVILLISFGTWAVFSIEKNNEIKTQRAISQNYVQSIMARLQPVTSTIEALNIAIGGVAENDDSKHTLLKQLVPTLLNTEASQQLIVSGGIWLSPNSKDEKITPKNEKTISKNKNTTQLFWSRQKSNPFASEDVHYSQTKPPLFEQNWYKLAKFLPKANSHWSKSYRNPDTKELLITAIVPIRINHLFAGAATIDVSLKKLDALFNTLQQDAHTSGYILVLDSYNNLLFNSMNPLAATKTSLLGQPFADLEQSYPLFKKIQTNIDIIDNHFYQQMLFNPAYQSPQLKELLEITPQNQQKRLMALINASVKNSPNKQSLTSVKISTDPIFNKPVLASILSIPKTQWKIIFVTPQSNGLQLFNAISLKVSGGLLLALLLVIIVLLIWQHRLFIQPISKISMAVKNGNINQLELDANRSNDAIGQVIDGFISNNNQLTTMSASLYACNLALEQQLAVQEHTQTELKSKNNLIDSLLKSIKSIIFIKGINGKYCVVSDEFCRLLGIERQQILGARDQDIYPRDLADSMVSHDDSIKKTIKAHDFEQIIPTIKGDRNYLVNQYPIKDDNDRLVALGAVAIDITNLKTHQYKQVQKTKKLATALARLKQSLMLLSDKPRTYDDLITTTTTAEQEYQKLLPHVIEQLITQQLGAYEQLFKLLLQPESADNFTEMTNKVSLQIDTLRNIKPFIVHENGIAKTIIVEHFLQGVLAVFSSQFKAKQVKVNIICSPDLTIQWSAATLFTICYQLINNTLFHGFTDNNPRRKQPRQLQIIIEQQQPQQLILKLKDNGIGLSKSDLTELQQQLKNQSRHTLLIDLNSWLTLHGLGEISINSVSMQFTEISCQINL